jgi:hypothetical protein
VTISAKPPRYRSYLLTFWEERRHDPALPVKWRFALEDPHTGDRRGFGSLEALTAALHHEMAGTDTREVHNGRKTAGQ